MRRTLTSASVIAFLFVLAGTSEVCGFTLKVQERDGTPVAGFRWLVEQDTTYPVTPGVQVTDSVGVNIRRTYAPVVAKGRSNIDTAVVDLPADKRYMVSVLPDSGHTLSGANVAAGQTTVTVVVNRLPVPTAQISVFVFADNQPINGAPDIPAEAGLEGFSVILHDAAGQVMMDAFGEALVKYLAPGKYGVRVVPPVGTDWIQVSTIEGTPTVDAWVKGGEPPYFAEWGFFAWHVFIGFVHPLTLPDAIGPAGTITGQVVYTHDNRPPLAPGLNPGRPVENAWVGLNNLSGADEQVYSQPCDPEGNFSITNLSPGTYQLVMWDQALDAIIDFRTITIPAEGGTVDLGPVPVYAWFGHLEGTVFYDSNNNGLREEGEWGIARQAVNIRFLDGSIYQVTETDGMGNYGFDEVFPFFFWLVTEVDFARFKATGATFVVDEGGALPEGRNNTPQPQPENNGLGWRTETGEVLTQAMLLYAGQTNEVHWGKADYADNENGGISGIVYYATTRAEDDPRYAAAEDWEPGIPRVQVNLYADGDMDNPPLGNFAGPEDLDWNEDGVFDPPDRVIDDLDGDGVVTLADVDNYPFGWPDNPAGKGNEDLDRNGNGVFDPGDAIQIGTTDSWDDNLPSGAVGPVQYVHGQPIRNGAETIATWNQLRPGVFDGGYAFNSYFPGGMASGSVEVDGLVPGFYVVEAVAPPGYEHVKEEDKNVDFGESYVPAPDAGGLLLLAKDMGVAVKSFLLRVAGCEVPLPPPICVGELRQVPEVLNLFPGVEAPYAGQWRPLPDRKQVFLEQGQNAAADFFMFTEVPKAGRIWGVVFNDVLLEFDPNNPNKGTNLGVPWLPISIKDWRGNELVRVYTDEWGKYNALVPSTFTVNLPTPSGVSPNILSVHLNDPGPIPDPNNPGRLITDPWYNPAYSQIATNWEFYPGKTTRLDTPILPIGAFTANRTPLDCELPDGSPIIFSVSGLQGGPYLPGAQGWVTITSVGTKLVPNPDYDPAVPGSTPTVARDYGFGSLRGTVTLGGVPLSAVLWRPSRIVVSVPANLNTQAGQLLVTRGDNGLSTVMGITLHLGEQDAVHVSPGQSIQQAIDSAPDKALILVAPGVYKENLIMWKPVKLQGWGAYSTVVQAGPMTPEEQAAWDAKLQGLIGSGEVALIPGERPDFYLERGAGVTVLSRPGRFESGDRARIDGLTITGAVKGGGIFVNAHANYLQITNNRIASNEGNFGGGIRIGTPSLINAAQDGYNSSPNVEISISHNHITQNGGVDGGGGVALFNGAHSYKLSHNVICGNFSLLYGGGVAHFGHSDGGTIANNKIINNEAFDEGGGIMVAGELVPAGAPEGTLTPGAGSVTINANLVQGNKAGDDGGGIRALMINGQDVQDSPTQPTNWHTIKVFNNMIVNNSSADAGGGISLDDTARVYIINNTIAHNDSTSTGVDAFGGPINEEIMPADLAAVLPPEAGEAGFIGGITSSVPQVAGVHTRAHSAGLQAAFGTGYEQDFSQPVLNDNIIWQNRSFFWDATYNDGWGGLRPDVQGGETPTYWDLAVTGTLSPQALDPRYCILTATSIPLADGGTLDYHPSNLGADPLFANPYFNVYQATSKGAAFGNFVVTTFLPTGLRGDYHISLVSPAVNLGGGGFLSQFPQLGADYDGHARPQAGVEAGADEINQGGLTGRPPRMRPSRRRPDWFRFRRSRSGSDDTPWWRRR